MNKTKIITNGDGTYDFQILDAGNNRILCFSRQGYEKVTDCINTAHSVVTEPCDPVLTFENREGVQV